MKTRRSDLGSDDRTVHPSQRSYLEAIAAGDAPAAQRIVREALGEGTPAMDILTDIVTPSMREIGDLWEQDVISVAEEHLATAITEGVLAVLYPAHYQSSPLSRERVLMACVAGDEHVLGLRMVGDVLEGAGFEVVFLGADIPIATLLAAVEEHCPDAVALSATARWSGAAVTQAVNAIRRRHPMLPLILGGLAIPDALADARTLIVGDVSGVLPRLGEVFGG